MFKKLNSKISLGALTAAGSFAPLTALAKTCGTGTNKTIYQESVDDCATCTASTGKVTGGSADCIITYQNDDITVLSVVEKVVGWLTTLVGIVAVLFLIYGGLVYITSAGNKDRAENAKKIITYSVIGLIVVVLARVIVSLVVNTAGEAV
jgi:hypothetical protein